MYYCISFAIISSSACHISSNHEGLNLKLVRMLPLAWAERELEQGCVLWKMAKKKILVTWEIKNESTFALPAWDKILDCIGCCQNLQRWRVSADTMEFCKAWSNSCWDWGVVIGISVTFGWYCEWLVKFDFQGGFFKDFPQKPFVSQMQQCVWEASQRKIGLTDSHIVHAENLLSWFSAPSLAMPSKWFEVTREETYSCGLFGDWSCFSIVPETSVDCWGVNSWAAA